MARPRRLGGRPPSTQDVAPQVRALWSAVLKLTVRDWLYGAAWVDGSKNVEAHAEAHRFLFAEDGPWAAWRRTVCELAGDRWARWVTLLARHAPVCPVCGGRRKAVTRPGALR